MKSFTILYRAAAFMLGLCIFTSTAIANNFEAVPTGWRLENYAASHTVTLWYTGAPNCTDGHIEGSGMTQDDYNRLWSLILTAKATNQKVGIFYNASGGNCTIVSFYAP